MTPSHARKAGRRYRYYVSSALSQGRPEAAGPVARVAAETIEALVVRALRECFPERVEADDRALVLDCLARAVIRDRVVEITLTQHDQKAIGRACCARDAEGLRQEVKPYNIRSTIISPGAVATELPDSITEPDVAEGVRELYERVAIPANSFAHMVAFAMSQPEDVDINEILFRPTRQEL